MPKVLRVHFVMVFRRSCTSSNPNHCSLPYTTRCHQPKPKFNSHKYLQIDQTQILEMNSSSYLAICWLTNWAMKSASWDVRSASGVALKILISLVLNFLMCDWRDLLYFSSGSKKRFIDRCLS